MPKEERQEALQPILDALSLPPSTYFPLATSSEKCCRVLRIAPHESIVFNTKARCPVMLICEVQREEYDLAQIDAHLGEPSPAADGASASAEAVQLKDVGDAPPTLVEKKKEPWGKKVDRLKRTSSLASAVPGWELRSFFVKSNDDLRQEVFVMQMIRYFQSIWPTESVWLNAYHIEATVGRARPCDCAHAHRWPGCSHACVSPTTRSRSPPPAPATARPPPPAPDHRPPGPDHRLPIPRPPTTHPPITAPIPRPPPPSPLPPMVHDGSPAPRAAPSCAAGP